MYAYECAAIYYTNLVTTNWLCALMFQELSTFFALFRTKKRLEMMNLPISPISNYHMEQLRNHLYCSKRNVLTFHFPFSQT